MVESVNLTCKMVSIDQFKKFLSDFQTMPGIQWSREDEDDFMNPSNFTLERAGYFCDSIAFLGFSQFKKYSQYDCF